MNGSDMAAVIRVRIEGWPAMAEADALSILAKHRIPLHTLTITPAEIIRKAFP